MGRRSKLFFGLMLVLCVTTIFISLASAVTIRNQANRVLAIRLASGQTISSAVGGTGEVTDQDLATQEFQRLIANGTITVLRAQAARTLNANLRITSPAQGTNLQPGQSVEVVVAIDPAVVNTVTTIQISLIAPNIAFTPVHIRAPQATSRATILIPVRVRGEATIEAIAQAGVPVDNRSSSVRVNIQHLDAALRITSPQEDARIDPRQPLTVEISINPAVVGVLVRSIRVNLMNDVSSLAEATTGPIASGANHRVTMQIPLEAVGRPRLGLVAAVDAPPGACANNATRRTIHINQYNAQVRIASPLEYDRLPLGRDLPVTVTVGPDAVGKNSGMEVKLSSPAAGEIASQTIRDAQANNTVNLRVPVISGGATLTATILPRVRFALNADSVELRSGQMNAAVDITSVQNNMRVIPGQDLEVGVSMNAAAAQAAERLNVVLSKDGRLVSGTNVQRLGFSNRARLTIPATATIGESYVVTATLLPQGVFTNGTSQRTLTVQRINAGLRITRPQEGETVRPGQAIDVETALSQEALAAVNCIGVTLQSAGAFVPDASRGIDNPGTSGRTTCRIPDTARPGTEVILSAVVAAPGRNIGDFCDNGRDEKRLRVGKVAADVKVTNPRDGSTVLPGQDLRVSVSMNKSAAHFVERIVVSLIKNNAPVAEAQIQRPSLMNQTTIRIPDGIKPGDKLAVRAAAEPNDILESFQDESAIRIKKPKENPKISAPGDNEKIKRSSRNTSTAGTRAADSP